MFWERGGFLITADKDRVDIDTLHAMLSQTYWARGRSRDAVEKTVANSLCFSIFKGDEHPEVSALRQVLWTADADDFYRQSGFKEMSKLKFMARSWKM